MKFWLFIVTVVFLMPLYAHESSTVSDQNPIPKRVFGSSPPMNYLLYALNPKKMIGLNFKAKNPNNNATKEYLDPYFLSLPVIGSFHGGGNNINLERLIAHRPDLVLLWEDDMLVHTVSEQIKKTHIPTVTVPFREIETMPQSIETVAKAIGESARGKLLADYARRIISEVNASVAKEKPTRYYYAEGLDGLSTECDASFHVVALNFAGGENVHKCRQSNLLGLEKISFETLLAYDPDVIIVQHALVFNDLMDDALWKNLRAVKEGRIYLVPTTPFNWIDRPPSFMRILGIQWLSKRFHPKAYEIDLESRLREFYELFLHVTLSDRDIKTLLGDS